MAIGIGEVKMAWGHTERALLHCRRSGRPNVSNLAITLARLAAVTGPGRRRSIYLAEATATATI
jgi:hypothetical protein